MTKKIKTSEASRAYRILTAPKTEQKDGIKLAALDKEGIFAVLRIANALKPVATALDDFAKDARERLRPDDWDEVVKMAQKFAQLSDEEKAEVNRRIADYEGQIAECIATEADKEADIDIAPMTEDAFAALVKENGHLIDLPEAMLLQGIMLN